MTAKFYAMLAFIIIMLGCWTYTHYQYELIEEAQLKELASYPIYAYVSDPEALKPLLAELKSYTKLAKIKHETGASAANELVTSYNLPVSNELLSGFRFPDVVTITLKPTDEARLAKPRILDALRRYLPEVDIDSQSTAWTKAEKQLISLHGRKISVTILIGILFLASFVYLRMNYELRLLLLQKRKMISVVDLMHYRSQIRTHSLLLFFVPQILNAGLYYGLVMWGPGYFGHTDNLIPYWMFLIQGGVMLIGTAIVLIDLYLLDHDNRYHREEITVTVPAPTPIPQAEPAPVTPISEPAGTEDHES